MTARDILQVLIELAPDVITLIDRDNVIRYISPSVERVAGYTPEEMIGKRCDEFVASGDLEALRNAFSKTLETRETVTSLIHFRRKDGGSIPLESLARNYLDVPEIDGILVSSRDMSRHIDLESTLRRSAEESADLFENAPCGYHTVDANDAFRRINVTELRWLQRTRDELVGKAKFSDFLSPVDRSAYGAEFEILKKGGAVRSDEFEVVRKDGTAFPALLQSMAVRDGSEAFVECRTTVYDITERKRCEYALTKVNRALHVLADARKQIGGSVRHWIG